MWFAFLMYSAFEQFFGYMALYKCCYYIIIIIIIIIYDELIKVSILENWFKFKKKVRFKAWQYYKICRIPHQRVAFFFQRSVWKPINQVTLFSVFVEAVVSRQEGKHCRRNGSSAACFLIANQIMVYLWFAVYLTCCVEYCS